MTERGPEGVNFGEKLSRSFVLAEKFRKSGVLDEKFDQESKNIANEKVREILSTSFPIPAQAEGQRDNIPQYESVRGMKEVVDNGGKLQSLRDHAEGALFDVGLALSQNKKILKAATEGMEELNKILPSNLHEIQPYILSVILTEGKDDVEGQERVLELVDLFKLKKKADAIHGEAEVDYKKTKDAILNKLYEEHEETVDEGEGGRIETVMGYIVGMDEKKEKTVPMNGGRGGKGREYTPVEINDKGEPEGGRSWEVSPQKAAEALWEMAYDLRWSKWTPPEWFGALDKETQKIFETMVKINSAGAMLYHSGKNLDDMYGNEAFFAITSQEMSRLFNKDFKLVVSKMMTDLCEEYVDQNGNTCLRYKECFYKYEERIDGAIRFERDGNNKRIKIPETQANLGKGGRTVDDDVVEKIQHIQKYKTDLAKFLADQNGRPEPNYLDLMYASTAWNLAYAGGDTSVWDRTRSLAPYDKVISDTVRTLNMEYKAMGKWQAMKKGEVKKDEDLLDAEYFSGNLGNYLVEVMKMERDLGGPIDGKKLLRDKIIDGDVSFLSHKLYYGFFDFWNGGGNIFEGSIKDDEFDKKEIKFYEPKESKNERVTLGQLVKNYAFDGDGNLIPEDRRREFNFGNKSVSFMNDMKDALEGATLAYNCLTTKEEIKDIDKWRIKFKSMMGEVSSIKFFGKENAFSYTTDPAFWRDILIGTMGYDKRRLSSDYVYLNKPELKKGEYEMVYNLYLFDLLTKDWDVGTFDININQLMRLLGVDVEKRENPEGIIVTARNARLERVERTRTDFLRAKVRRKFKYDEPTQEIDKIVRNVDTLASNGSQEFFRLKKDFQRAVLSGSVASANRLYQAMLDESAK